MKTNFTGLDKKKHQNKNGEVDANPTSKQSEAICHWNPMERITFLQGISTTNQSRLHSQESWLTGWEPFLENSSHAEWESPGPAFLLSRCSEVVRGFWPSSRDWERRWVAQWAASRLWNLDMIHGLDGNVVPSGEPNSLPKPSWCLKSSYCGLQSHWT